MTRFSGLVCAGLLLATPALAAPGDIKSAGASWHVSLADSLTPAVVVDLVKAPAKGQPGDKDVVAVSRQFARGQKSLRRCAVSGAPQASAWALDPVWVVYFACK
jgi:hypothetical protein